MRTPAIIALGLALLVLSPTAQAEPPTRISLVEALRRAGRQAPELARADAVVRGASSLVDAADTALTRNPTATVGVGPRSVAPQGEIDLDVTATLMFPVPLTGVGAAREHYADAVLQVAQTDRAVVMRQARRRAASAWLDARGAARIVSLREQALANADELLRIAEVRADVGAGNPSEAPLARAEVGQAKAALARAQRRQAIALAGLRYTLGLDAGAPVAAVGELDVARLPAEASVRDGLREHPRLERTLSIAEAAEREADLTRAEAGPSLSFGPSFTREGTGDWLVLGQLSMPLPFTNTGVVAAADARRRAGVARAAQGIVARGLDRDVSRARAAHRLAVKERDVLHEDAVGPAGRALELALLQYREGTGQLADVLQARRSLVAAQLQLTQAVIAMRRAELELRATIGWPEALRRPGPTRAGATR